METLIQDLRYAVRMLTNRPGFTLIATLSLALGVGANTTIYSLVHSVLLRPLPVEEPDRLVAITSNVISYPAYTDFRNQNKTLSDLAAYSPRELSMATGGQPVIIQANVVTGNYFDVLGVKASRGRTFLPEEDQAVGTHPVAVISHSLWQKSFGGDKEVVGKTLSLNGQGFTIIGVTPQGFRGARLTSSSDIWIPVMMWPGVATGSYTRLDINFRGWGWLSAIGRLKPGVSLEQAQADLNVLAEQQKQAYPQYTGKSFSVTLHPITTAVAGVKTRGDLVRFIGLLMAVVGIALAIACANIANLLLARATGRRREIAIRMALGASRSRLIRQLLTESLLLSLLGGAAGLLVAVWAIDLLSGFELPGQISLGKLAIGLNSEALVFTLLLSLVTGIVFGLAPAIQASRPDLVPALKDQASSPGAGKTLLRNSLVAAQVALCLLLLIGAGLFVRSLRNALSIDVGFNPDNVALASVNLGLQRYDAVRARGFYEQITERVESLPGVTSASWAAIVPVSSPSDHETIKVEGYTPAPGEQMSAEVNAVWDNYFRTLQIPLVKGREFSGSDREGAEPVVVVNEAMARRFWPDQDPVGKRVTVLNIPAKVIGVARDSKYHSLTEEPLPFIYLPLAQMIGGPGLSTVTMVVRAADDPSAVIASVQREARAIDPDLPVFNLKTLDEHLGDLLMAHRFGATLLGMFSLLAMTLAVVGIYGVVSYSVSQRTREIGIRMALGAQGSDVLKLVLGRGIIPVLIGVGVGLGAAVALTRVLSSFLYGVSATDATTFITASMLLVGAALAASFIPARRATRVDPMAALRYE